MGFGSWLGKKTKKFISGGMGTSPLTKFGFWRRALGGIKNTKRYQERIVGEARNVAVVNILNATERLNDHIEEIYKNLTKGIEPSEFQEAVEGALTECDVIEKSGPRANSIFYQYTKNELDISAIKELWLKIKGGKSITIHDEELFREEEHHWRREKSELGDIKRKKYYSLAISLYKIYKRYIHSVMTAHSIE